MIIQKSKAGIKPNLGEKVHFCKKGLAIRTICHCARDPELMREGRRLFLGQLFQKLVLADQQAVYTQLALTIYLVYMHFSGCVG